MFFILKESWDSPPNKIPIFSEDIVKRIFDYLNFRHLYAHGYWFHLKWDKMILLIDAADKLWIDIKKDTESFFKGLEEGSHK